MGNNETASFELNGICQPAQYFVWGLSSSLLVLLLVAQMIWTVVTYLIWLDANLYSSLCRAGRRIRGPFRAASDLVDAMTEVLGHHTCAYSNAELATAMERYGGVRYYTDPIDENGVAHIGLSCLRVKSAQPNPSSLYGGHLQKRRTQDSSHLRADRP